MISSRRKLWDPCLRRYPIVLVGKTKTATRYPGRSSASTRALIRRPHQIETIPQYACLRRRYLSSDASAAEVSIEDCARSIALVANNQSAVSMEAATELAHKLSPQARREFVSAAEQSNLTAAAAATQQEVLVDEVPPPTLRDLRLVALAQAIPFLGFGFMDNAILIVAGDAIDQSLGVVLGISTLCAAAIGNIISDVAGIMMGTVIEDFCANYLKLPMPNLSNAQRQLRSVRFASQMGCGVGIVVGCIIGMFPLMFIDSNRIHKLKRDAALQEIFDDVMSESKTLIGAQSASLFILVENDPRNNESPIPNPDGQYLYAKYFHSDSGEVTQRTFKVGRGIVSRAALTGQAWNIHDVDSEPDFSHEMTDQKARIKNMVCVPVLDSNGKPIAVIRAFNKVAEGSLVGNDPSKAEENKSEVQRRGFTNNDVQVLKALASHISVSLQYMYQEGEEENADKGIKDTIRILKEHGLSALSEDKTASTFNRRRPLFPET
ncbi:Transmembrane protein 65 [Seminavis robusta]|uniref:Transmembrane protein 65 n=1 Tax=Seminavis robusta TaxID=568900 RepID=A0A9N8D7V2_9STRA|nr:Transmembrane protein 65 [Seminavis robusta]|eukprot:Sro30_g019610.1 Transmembrane protein 65 (492) ;mRNA; f:75516-77318